MGKESPRQVKVCKKLTPCPAKGSKKNSAAKGLRTIVGIGSRSQDELDDWDSKLVISSKCHPEKEERGVRVASGGQG